MCGGMQRTEAVRAFSKVVSCFTAFGPPMTSFSQSELLLFDDYHEDGAKDDSSWR